MFKDRFIIYVGAYMSLCVLCISVFEDGRRQHQVLRTSWDWWSGAT